MRIHGNVLILGNVIEKQENYYSGKKRNNVYSGQSSGVYETPYQATDEEADSDKPPAAATRDYTQSTLYPYIVDKSKAMELIEWMHTEIGAMKKPKSKLKIVQALYRGGQFNASIPHDAYCGEFGELAKSRYSEWMSDATKYKTEDLDIIYEQYLAYLG